MGLHKFDNKKELKKLDFKNNKAKYIKIGTICISILVVIVSIIYFTYSKFTLTDMFTTVESTMDTFLPGDYILDFYIDGERTLDISNDKKYYGKINCLNGETGSWDWLTSNTNITNATERTKCNVNLTQAAAEPELYAGLIPITYDESNNIVIADTKTKWYDYEEHRWANAILINQSSSSIKNKYINGDGTFKVGTIVDLADVLQMYVWIPRYKYRLFYTQTENTYSNTEQMIDIRFEDVNTPKSTGTNDGEWLTHPAFTFGTTELNGIWVGKFEPSNSTSDIRIIPNVSSLRNQADSSIFNGVRSIESNSKYGLVSSEVDTHMMKNMEWGAVAYLTVSIYGRYNDDGTEIESGPVPWFNNNSNYTTGCSGNEYLSASSSSCNAWNTSIGINASTTGNIYGIYDMSGGAFDGIMGNMVTSSGAYNPINSSLSQPESKYYDSYPFSSATTTNERILVGKLGDATRETRWWYVDLLNFPKSSYPWFVRGGSVGQGAFNTEEQSFGGLFYINTFNGFKNVDVTFRVVLTRN